MTLAQKVIGRIRRVPLALRLADNTRSAEVQRCSEYAVHSDWESLSIGRPISLPNGGQNTSPNKNLRSAIHVMGPTLTALLFAGVGSGVAHAQGTMDFSGAQTLMSTFKTFAMYAGAVICLGGLIFAGIRMMSGRFQDAIPGLFGALFGAGVLGWGAGLIGSLTGQSM